LEIPLDAVETAVRLAQKYKVRVILNPAPYTPLPVDLLSQVDILTPNETECALMAEQFGLDISGQHYLKLYEKLKVNHLVVTQGKKGALVVSKGMIKEIPGYAVNAVDTTAAGDTFNGGLACALAQGTDIFEAVRYANAAAALSTMKTGAQTSMPDAKAVGTFINLMLDYHQN
jgi:ribokinase